jgi:polyisoprenyl-phosphate glycosyltransferase
MLAPTVSVIVPIYNNERTLVELCSRIRAALYIVGADYEIILVNDGSQDGSIRMIRTIAEADPRCIGLFLSRNFGQHPAISAGLEHARGEITVLMDADLQDRPEELPRLLEALGKHEVDIVYTTFGSVDGQRTRLTSRAFHLLYSKLTNLDLPSNLGTYRAFSRQVREALLAYPERNAVYGPLMAQMGYEHVYLDVARDAAVGRKTSYTFRKRISLATSAIISYGSALHRFVSIVGFVLTVLSTTYLCALIIQYLSGYRHLVNGQLLLLTITLLMSGVLLMTVGILTAYTYRIFQEVLARPRYHIAHRVGVGLGQPDES